jgi:tRNA threonylcarbamoyladenosine biosynthesis protein TsaE
MPVLLTHSVDQTEATAASLALSLRPGDCIALSGELGAGKTQFVRGLVRGLGGNPRSVSSPTFVLLNVYDHPAQKHVLYHLDAYRITTPEDFESIGFAELLTQGGVVVVEWPQRIEPLLPPDCIRVHIEPLGETVRRIEIRPPSRPSVSG